jgi:hypothetical protein
VTVLASRPIVEDSLEIARSLGRQWAQDNPNDPRLNKLRQIEHYLRTLLDAQPDQMAQHGAATFEDYLDDAKQPETAAQAKNYIDMIATWRREAKSGQGEPLARPQCDSQHPYHRTALAFGYVYRLQVSSKIDYFVYSHPVGHTLEFAKLPAEAGDWEHNKRGPDRKREHGCDHASLITYLLARHDLKVIADSTPATNLLASPNEVAK